MSVAGTMQWLTKGMPVAKSFIYSIYHSIGYGALEGSVPLSIDAKNCIYILRILMICLLVWPDSMATKIESHREIVAFDYVATVDASTGKGCGAMLQLIDANGIPSVEYQYHMVIRWTPEELVLIAKNPGIINCLEYVTAMMALNYWQPLLSGNSVEVHCDNRAALKWLITNTTKSLGNVRNLVRLSALMETANNITVRYKYINTNDNTIADWLSRDDDLQENDGLTEALRGQPGSASYIRAANCRKLLTLALSDPSDLPMQNLLDLVQLLR